MTSKSIYRHYYFFVVAVAFTSVFSSAACAQDKAAAIDSIFNFTRPAAPGCVCAVSQNGKVVLSRAYGMADLERNIPLSENSIFDIGSTHKQFVATAILLLVEDKRISLSDDVRKHIPQMPDYGYKITIDHLLTHTSGIRDWTGLLNLAEGDPDVLTLILRQRGLNFPPGEEWSYSNSGYVLLKEIVTRVSGSSFAEFARKRIFVPLGMRSTSYSVDMRDVSPNRALAYEKDGTGFKVSMRLDNNRGGGGILSTAGDLLIWNDALADSKFGKFVTAKLQEPAKLNNGRQLKYARALFVDPYRGGIPMIAHSGGSAGYSTWLGRFPTHGLSVAVLCNVEPISATRLAYRVADLFLPTAGIKEVEGDGPPPVIPEGIDISSKTGLYFNDQTGDFMHLTVDRGRLRVADGPGLVAESSDRFHRWGAALQFMSQDSFEIYFKSPDEFELKSMEGKTTHYRRAKPYSYSAAGLKEFAGRYESTDIGTVFRIEPVKNGLSVTLDHAPDKILQFEAFGPETFLWNKKMIIRFLRSSSGKITSFEYSNPVLSKVNFSRIDKTD